MRYSKQQHRRRRIRLRLERRRAAELRRQRLPGWILRREIRRFDTPAYSFLRDLAREHLDP